MHKEKFFGLLLLAATVTVFLLSDKHTGKSRGVSNRERKIHGTLNNDRGEKRIHEGMKSGVRHNMEKLGNNEFRSQIQKYTIQAYAELDNDIGRRRDLRITLETVENHQKLLKMRFKQGMILLSLSVKSRCIKELEITVIPVSHQALILKKKWRWKYFIENESIAYSKKYPTTFKQLVLSKYDNVLLRSKYRTKTSPRLLRPHGMQLMSRMIFGTRYLHQGKDVKYLKDVVFRN